MTEAVFQATMHEIINALQEKGLDPAAQLEGYLRTGNDAYITQHQNARAKVRAVGQARIRDYLDTVLQKKSES